VEGEADEFIQKERRELTNSLERFLAAREFECQMIPTHLEDMEVCEKACFDLLVVHEKNDITIYSSGLKYIAPEMEEYLRAHKPPHLEVCFHPLDEKGGLHEKE